MRVLTVRNVPDDLYAALVRQAEQNRRSLQQQVLVLLERGRDLGAAESPLETAQRIRAQLAGRPLGDTVAEIRADRER